MGGLVWIFSGWILTISGAGRELMEGITSLVAVLVLLYVGFWLHSKTEIHR
jgi:high-affinity iron transporter